MDACTHEVRLNQWKLIIEQCQSRPDGQTARPWMAENGVQEKTYYYWLRRVRKEVYSQLSDGSTSLPAMQEKGSPHDTATESGNSFFFPARSRD